MILLVHLLLGALIGQKISNPVLAIVLAFLSHYFLDLLPHIDYPIENIHPVKSASQSETVPSFAGQFNWVNKKQWRKILPDILKIALDFCLGILLILIFSKNQPIIYACALLAILPDGFIVLNYLAPNKILEIHNKLHQKIQFLKDNPAPEQVRYGARKISKFWRITSQVIVVVISIILFKA